MYFLNPVDWKERLRAARASARVGHRFGHEVGAIYWIKVSLRARGVPIPRPRSSTLKEQLEAMRALADSGYEEYAADAELLAMVRARLARRGEAVEVNLDDLCSEDDDAVADVDQAEAVKTAGES